MINEKEAKRKVKLLERELTILVLLLVSKFESNKKTRALLLNDKNIRLSALAPLFKDFNKKFQADFLKSIFIETIGFKTDFDKYYKGLGFKKFTKAHKDIVNINKALRPYFTDFAGLGTVRLDLQGTIVSGLASNITPSALSNAIKKELSGKLQKYYQEHLWNELAQVERIENNFYAKELKLDWFVYEGGLIETSRDFCIKRNGKLFNRKDAKTWRFDPTLPQPETADAYQPLVELGRFNCRHSLRWITDETAKEMKR